MFFTKEKLIKRIEEVEPYIYKNRTPIMNWFKKEDTSKQLKYPPVFDDTWEPINFGDKWEGRDGYFWFQTEFDVPHFTQEEHFTLIFDFGITWLANLGGFESLLFINDVPYQGIDTYHHETYLDYKEHSGKKIKLSLKAWTGLEGGGEKRVQEHFFNYADFAYEDKNVKDFYYLSKNLIDTVETLGDEFPESPNYTKILNHAWNLVDFSYKGSEDFYNSIMVANDYLQKEINKIPKHTPITVQALGHTHIDVAWLWRLKHTREKAARSFSTVLKLMDEYPEYVFLQTQPQIYAYLKEDYPELYERIKEKVAEGRWEVDGAMWLEADCNIPSGESLVRQILLGKNFIKNEFGKESTYLWLPDVFGYSWALPQILKKSGIDTFMTTKISWNQYNQMPHDTFMWRGIDGTEILTHFITTPEPGRVGDSSFSWRYTYNGFLQPNIVKGIYDNYHDKEVNQELLLAYGYGDGGGGVNRVMLENRRQMDRIAGLPKVKTGTASDYFKRLGETVKNTESYVHTWDGELYLEFHRGTYTSQARNKKYNRQLELALRNTEIVNTFKMVNCETNYPLREINDVWKILARNQFHDIIPGSAIEEVYEDSDKDYEKAFEIIDSLEKNDSDEEKVTLLNNTNWQRSEWIKVPENKHLMNENGDELIESYLSDGKYCYIEDMPPMSKKGYILKEDITSHVDKGNPYIDHIETKYYLLQWNDKGQLTRVFDKKAKREVLLPGSLGNQLQLFEDKPIDFNAWDIDIFYQQKMSNLEANSAKVLHQDGNVTEVQFDYSFGTSNLKQVMRIFSDSRRIDFITTVDWKEREQLLKVAFPVDIRATEATFDIQYGNVKRPTHWNTSWDMAKFETVGHQWTDLSEDGYGVGLLNDCKYGYDVKDNTLRLSLLKGGIYPNPVADEGKHEFTYSLYPHENDYKDSDMIASAWQLNDPLKIVYGDLGTEDSLFTFNNDIQIAVDAIKRSEKGNNVLIRFHDYSGGRQEVSILPHFDYVEVYETNLMEEKSDIAVDLENIYLKPFEIKTLLFEREG